MRPQVSRRTPLYFLAAQSSDSACGISASSNILFTQLTVPSALSAPVRARAGRLDIPNDRQDIGGKLRCLGV
jgi:hypothetical protein